MDVDCPHCEGNGLSREKCLKCAGKGWLTEGCDCNGCKGGEGCICPDCWGTGAEPCYYCEGTGRITRDDK